MNKTNTSQPVFIKQYYYVEGILFLNYVCFSYPKENSFKKKEKRIELFKYHVLCNNCTFQLFSLISNWNFLWWVLGIV